jgi:hypothetical protein
MDARLGLPMDILLLSKRFPFKSVYEAEEVVRKYVRSSLPTREVAYESIFGAYMRMTWA